MFSSKKKHLFLALGLAALLVTATGSQAKVEGDTIYMGVAVSLTGKYSTNGKNTKDGYDLAVKRINEMGGVKVGGKSYKISLIYYDDESTPARAAQLTERLINQDGVKFMLGAYGSGITKAMAPVTEKYQIPHVEGNGAARELFTQGYKYLFATLSTSDYYLREAVNLMAEVAKQQGKKPSQVRIAMAFENDPFSLDIRAGVTEDAKKHGMKVVVDDKLPPELNDMSATLTKVKALKPDMLVVSGHAKGATLVARQTEDMQVKVPMVATTHCDSAKIAENLGAAAEGILCASQWDRSLSYKDKWFGTAEEYAKLFEKEFNYAPPYQAAESTAAVLVYVDAFQRANSFDTKKVRDAIAKTDLMTFYGPIKFDSTGKNIAKPMVLYQVQGGEYKVVAPQRWASAKLIFPRQEASAKR
ncbi:amino acid ABC transporter substrate-binding protein [Sulfurifustis variabilis]|uniref:Amino acid ABC transporter substrate-binding protein n=1 Tax=Sulfurifustis variabilis TaxID=1675686 RepID=A0A1B4V0E1_9GAMM|nr:amino acid ABC transporter substrate-binding protein [Sulfurifustis variabilis]BAU46908.1 amino acid ABC transporter substrate-binding protein [Sulfurifustis variabilis]